MTAEVATEVVTSEPVSEKKPVSSVATSLKTTTSTTAQMPEVPAGKEEVVAVKEEEEGAAPAAVFKGAYTGYLRKTKCSWLLCEGEFGQFVVD